MKLTQVPNLRLEDFPSEQQTWLGRLFINLNPFIQSLNQILDNNIDYATNIKAMTRQYDITQFQPFSFTWAFKTTPPVSLVVTKALKGTDLTPTILGLAWNYDASTALISVTSMAEIATTGVSELSGRYQFTVRATI